MAVKKMVSNEPEWLFIRKKEISKKKTTDTVTPYVVNTDRPEVRFVFNGMCAELFGEKYIVFSDITNPERIYFKIDANRGYKATRYKKSAQVHFMCTEEQRTAFSDLWAGTDYEVHEQRGYFYIERKDEIEALFEEPKQLYMDLTEKGKHTPPANAAYMSPMPESGITDKKVLAILSRMKERGYVALYDLKAMNMNDREYYKAVNDLVMIYGYAIVDIPCVDATGKRFYVKALYNNTGVWE